MNPLARAFNAIGGTLMVRTGRIGILVTTGRKSGRPRTAPLGYLLRPDGSIILAAGGAGRAWAENLQVNPVATFRIKRVTGSYRGRLLVGDERTAALEALKAKQGASGERAKWSEVFVLDPVADRGA